MVFRKTLALLFALLFVTCSMVTFLVYGLADTFLKPDFYSTKVGTQLYDVLVKVSAKRIVDSDAFLAKSFDSTAVEAEIRDVFNGELYDKLNSDVVEQINGFKEDASKPVVISLKTFRSSLLTVAHNLAFKYFKTLPACNGGQVPEHDLNGLPTCVPQDTDYSSVIAPLSGQFEKDMFTAVPEQITYNFNSADSGNNLVVVLFQKISTIRHFLYAVLVTFLIIIVMLIYGPFPEILKYVGGSFIGSGVIGYFLSFGLDAIPSLISSSIGSSLDKNAVTTFIELMFSYLIADVQKMALIFLAFGGVLVLMQVFLKKK